MLELTTPEAFTLAIGAMLAGIILLIRGGDWTIDASVFVARKFGISPLVIGFTVVAFGTSLPEMVVSVLANLQGSPGIAIGNVLGSNIANILLVIGATAIFAPLVAQGKGIVRDLSVMLLATALLTALLVTGHITRIAGTGMMVFLCMYVFYQYMTAARGETPPPLTEEEEAETEKYAHHLAPYFYLLLGLAAIALGAEFLVRGTRVSASIIGVPEAVIALSVIALGTSLPELSTCIIAGRKGHSDIVLGNIIGSNVFNILFVLGATALAAPILPGSFAAQLAEFDIWLVVAVSLIFTVILLTARKITAPVGWLFLGAYILYNIYIYIINLSM